MSQRIIGSYPETLLMIGSVKFMRNIEEITTLPEVWASLPKVPVNTQIFSERDFCWFSGDVSENRFERRFSSPSDFVEELVLCAIACSVVNLSSNITRITLHRSCFPVCLPHDGSNFLGHLCWVVGWRQCDIFNVMPSL